MKNKIIKGLAVLALLLIAAGTASYVVLLRHPNLILKLRAIEIAEGETREVSFECKGRGPGEGSESVRIITGAIPLYKFTPAESAGYSVRITDIKCDEDVNIRMSVMDQDLADYASAENYDRESESITAGFTAEASLQAGQECFIMIEASPGDDSVSSCSGSFKLSVAKTPEKEQPPEIFPGESVKLKVGAHTQAAAIFNPQETGYYRFTTAIEAGGKASGYSMVSSVTGRSRQTVGVTEGICRLEQGREYYVWVSVYETDNKKSRVRLSCEAMNTAVTWEKGAVHVSGNTVIEYRPSEAGNVAVYSVSAGDPKVLIYEKEGFPLRTDDDTESSLSGNPGDFAVAFRTEKGIVYRICIFDGPEDYDVVITDYIGDGSTLTADDIAPLPEQTEEPADSEDMEEEGSGNEESETG